VDHAARVLGDPVRASVPLRVGLAERQPRQQRELRRGVQQDTADRERDDGRRDGGERHGRERDRSVDPRQQRDDREDADDRQRADQVSARRPDRVAVERRSDR
jgi:hypothetical protein